MRSPWCVHVVGLATGVPHPTLDVTGYTGVLITTIAQHERILSLTYLPWSLHT